MELSEKAILAEIKNSLKDLLLRVEQLEALDGAPETPSEPIEAAMEPVDLDIALDIDDIPAEEPAVEENIPAEEPAIMESIPAEEPAAEPQIEDLPTEEPVEEAVDIPAEEPAAEPQIEDLPTEEPVEEAENIPAEEPVLEENIPAEQEKKEEAVDEKPANRPAVIDVMTSARAWKADIPGAPVNNILSAISLNDRILFINTLFGKDPVLFQNTIKEFNSYVYLVEAENYIMEHFPMWDLNSDTVYRFMMAVRRKLE